MCTIEAIVNARDGRAPHEYHDAKLEESVAGWYCDAMSAYVVELITEDVNAFAVVVEDVKTAFHVSSWIPERQRHGAWYVADSAKQIATPKKKVENTTTSAVVAVPYLGCKE